MHSEDTAASHSRDIVSNVNGADAGHRHTGVEQYIPNYSKQAMPDEQALLLQQQTQIR